MVDLGLIPGLGRFPGEGNGYPLQYSGLENSRDCNSIDCIISVTQSCPTLCDPMDCSVPGFPVHHQLPELDQTHVLRVSDAIQPSHPLLFPSPTAFNLSKHWGLFQGIFPTQGSNPGLLHCRLILYQLSHQGGSRILGWVAYPFSSRSSQPQNRTGVSCIAGRFFTN